MKTHLIVSVIATVILCTGCAATNQISYKKLVAQNNQAISKLSVGMSKSDVIHVMGDYFAKTHNGVINNPLRIESVTRDNDVYEKLFYLTRPHHFYGTVNESQTTVVVLKNGKVVGWGKDAAMLYQ